MVSFCLNMFSLERSGAVSYKMDHHQYPMVTFFDDSTDDENQGFLAIEQFVTDVVDFSSQYGSDISITYTAYNLAGKPSKYPDYGDFPQAFVMRTYGNWWSEAPSRREIFMPQNLGKIVSQDYIDLRFEQAVFPVSINIYETFNPGSVVRIWAGLDGGKWELLWEGESKPYGHTARIFSPPLRLIDEATSLIRLEFDHSSLEYYTQLDAVLLSGTNRRMKPSQRNRFTYGRGAVGGGTSDEEEDDEEEEVKNGLGNGEEKEEEEEEREECRARTPPPSANGINDKVFNLDLTKLTLNEWSASTDTTKHKADTNLVKPSPSNGGLTNSSLSEVCDILFKELEDDPWWSEAGQRTVTADKGEHVVELEVLHPKANSGPFGLLPDETLLYIFGFLDLVSLSNCCTVNRHFHSIVMDSLLYTDLNLKPYWPWMTPDSLTSLSKRCHHLSKLDLSWCFSYCHIPVNFFSDFIEQCGKNLIILRLDCCKFIDNSCVRTITSKCKYLKELTLRNCSKITTIGFEYIADLNTLERLDLYRTTIETAPLVKILKASPKLKHINLGGCVRVSSMDEVAQAMGNFNQELVTIDFWKTYSLTPVGVRALSQCSKLEEVDLGWCLGLSIPGDCMTSLAVGCPRMRKLFMAALRGITDRDLLPFVTRCPRLQQLDLLGLRCITADICLRFLSNCKELQLLDVSFCDQIQESDVLLWRVQFPEVAIKWSFQYDGGNDYYLPNHY